MKCRICGNGEYNSWYNIPEMRFGMNESFPYLKCSSCGCLQIKEYPSNIADYYPSEYYSFSEKLKSQSNSGIKGRLRSRVALHCTGVNPNLVGRLLYKQLGGGTVEKIKNSKAGLDDKILEVGSGSGNNLIRLNKYGFRSLWGIDPFIKEDINHSNQVKVLKKSVFELGEKDFDLVFLNHSFEHMPDPLRVLKVLSNLIGQDKYIMISIPVIDTYPWRRYGVNWVGLCAPRHFYLHSVKSMAILAKDAGMSIERFEFKTTAFDFWASEQYSIGIPLQHETSYYWKKKSKMFPKDMIRKFERAASELDDARDGSTAVFYLKNQ